MAISQPSLTQVTKTAMSELAMGVFRKPEAAVSGCDAID
jgi:hypothetical protein